MSTPTPPQNPYEPPISVEATRRGLRVGPDPVALVAAGAVLSAAWPVYVELQSDGAVSAKLWRLVALLIGLWAIAAILLVKKVSWARGLVRLLAALVVAGTLYSFRQRGTWLFFVVAALRALIYGALFWSLRRPRYSIE